MATPHDLSTTDAVVLAGGRATRLAPVAGDRPKLLVPVAGRPFLERLLAPLVRAHIRRVILCLGHLHHRVLEHLALRPPGAALELVPAVEPRPLGTAGALKSIASLLRTSPALVLNGDSFVDADFARFLAFHQERRALLSMVLARVPDGSRYGSVEVGSDGAVLAFHEKRPAPDRGRASEPITGRASSGLVNAGVYLFEREVIDGIPADRPVSLEREVFPAWCGRSFFGYAGPFRFIDIGTPESLAAAQEFFTDDE